MSMAAIIRRETRVSIAINAGLSLLFFLAVFGLKRPVGFAALGWDFLPQAFMVALMGSLVPGLLVRRHGGATVASVVRRAILLAVVGVAVAGGGAFLLCRLPGDASLATGIALPIKIAFGAVLAAIVTPVAVRATLTPLRSVPA